MSRLESVNARAASKYCGLCAASFSSLCRRLSFPSSPNDSVHRCSFVPCPTRTRRRRSCISRDRYLESGHLMAAVLLRETVLFCRFKYEKYLNALSHVDEAKLNVTQGKIIHFTSRRIFQNFNWLCFRSDARARVCWLINQL